MSAFLTPDQKKALGPLLGLLIFIVAVLGGIALNTVFGGPRVPVVSDFAAIVLGIIGGIVIFRELSK